MPCAGRTRSEVSSTGEEESRVWLGRAERPNQKPLIASIIWRRATRLSTKRNHNSPSLWRGSAKRYGGGAAKILPFSVYLDRRDRIQCPPPDGRPARCPSTPWVEALALRRPQIAARTAVSLSIAKLVTSLGTNTKGWDRPAGFQPDYPPMPRAYDSISRCAHETGTFPLVFLTGRRHFCEAVGQHHRCLNIPTSHQKSLHEVADELHADRHPS